MVLSAIMVRSSGVERRHSVYFFELIIIYSLSIRGGKKISPTDLCKRVKEAASGCDGFPRCRCATESEAGGITEYRINHVPITRLRISWQISMPSRSVAVGSVRCHGLHTGTFDSRSIVCSLFRATPFQSEVITHLKVCASYRAW